MKVNKKIYDYIQKNNPAVVYGGSMSGKSYTTAQYIVIQLLQNKQRALVLRKYATTLRYSVWKLFQSILLNEKIRFETKYSEILLPNGSEIIFKGLDDIEKIKGIEASIVWLEEATEFTEDDYYQALLRLRTGKERKIILTFNPIFVEWLYELTQKVPSLKVIPSDNPFLENEHIEILDRLQGINRKIYLEGEFAKDDMALVFKDIHIVKDTSQFKILDIVYGVDFGYNNPTAVVKIGILDDGFIILEDFKQSHITNSELIQILKNDMKVGNSLLVCDSAEPQRIQEMRVAGLNAVGSIKGEVFRQIQKLLQMKIYISEEAVNTIKEMKTYSYITKNGLITDQILKVNDHCIDAMRYAIIFVSEKRKNIDFFVGGVYEVF